MQRRNLAFALCAVLVLGGCRAPREIRPAFVHESAPSAKLPGAVVFSGQTGRLYALFGVKPGPESQAVAISPNGSEERAPAFSPDGSKVAFSVNSTDTQGIFVRSRSGGERTAVVTGSGYYDHPTW